MSQPVDPKTDGLLAQILLEQGRQGTQLAVITEKLSSLPDHETRLRNLEQGFTAFKNKVVGIVIGVGALVGIIESLLEHYHV
jgi:hypothetical protein